MLTFTTWIGDADEVPTADTAAGYHVCLDHLAAWLDGEDSGPIADADTARWDAAYAELVAASPPAG